MHYSRIFFEAASKLPLPEVFSKRVLNAVHYFEQHDKKRQLFPVIEAELTAGKITQEQACWLIAQSVHENQPRRNGKPYMSHIEAVVNAPDYYPYITYTQNQRMLAIVHDCGEDSFGAWKADDFRKLGFDEEFCLGFDGITRRKGEPYFDFIERLSVTIAPPVKLGDNNHNWADSPKPSSEKRYRISSHFLRDMITGKESSGSNIVTYAARTGFYDEALFRQMSSRPIITNYQPPAGLSHMASIPAPAHL